MVASFRALRDVVCVERRIIKKKGSKPERGIKKISHKFKSSGREMGKGDSVYYKRQGPRTTYVM
jgi:hypothetical protein